MTRRKAKGVDGAQRTNEADVLDRAIRRHQRQIRWSLKRMRKLDGERAMRAGYSLYYAVADLLDELDA